MLKYLKLSTNHLFTKLKMTYKMSWCFINKHDFKVIVVFETQDSFLVYINGQPHIRIVGVDSIADVVYDWLNNSNIPTLEQIRNDYTVITNNIHEMY